MKQKTNKKRKISDCKLTLFEQKPGKIKHSTYSTLRPKKIDIYKDRIYRYVDCFVHLFKSPAHVSIGELSWLSLSSDYEYKIVPFSHVGESGALFEMEEQAESELSFSPKLHQPGTAIVEDLNADHVKITRIFYHPEKISGKMLSEILKLKVELVPCEFERYLENPDRIRLTRNIVSVPTAWDDDYSKVFIQPSPLSSL